MVEYHSHSMLKILELLVIDILDLRVADFAILNQWKQHISCQSLHLQVENLGDLALLQTLVDPADMLPESGIVIVLYAVIRSALQQLGDVCPLVSLVPVQQVQDPLLFTGPGRVALDHWVQVVVPSLTALFTCAAADMIIILQHLCDVGPSLRAIFLNQTHNGIILVLVPKFSLACLLA